MKKFELLNLVSKYDNSCEWEAIDSKNERFACYRKTIRELSNGLELQLIDVVRSKSDPYEVRIIMKDTKKKGDPSDILDQIGILQGNFQAYLSGRTQLIRHEEWLKRGEIFIFEVPRC